MPSRANIAPTNYPDSYITNPQASTMPFQLILKTITNQIQWITEKFTSTFMVGVDLCVHTTELRGNINKLMLAPS